MAAYTVINGTEGPLTDVDGSTDIDALSYKNGITLTNAQLATLCSTLGVACTSDLTGLSYAAAIKRVQAIAGTVVSA